MKTFQEFMSLCEKSDPDAASQLGWGGGASITRQGEGGRIGKERKKSEAERRRTKRGPGGTTVPAKPYKPRSDIGTQRSSDTRTQAPEQERGSADVRARAAAAAKEERRKAALARRSAKTGGETPSSKPKTRDLEKQASALLSKKKPEEPKGEKIERTTKRKYTRDEKKKMVRAGKRLLSDIQKGRNLPASKYQP
jgi:hypothetical protein